MSVTLIVSGYPFVTSLETARRSPFLQSVLDCLYDTGTVPSSIKLDRDYTHFRHVLNWMRGSRFLPACTDTLIELKEEASFFRLADMSSSIDQKLSFLSIKKERAPKKGKKKRARGEEEKKRDGNPSEEVVVLDSSSNA
jgi:hypothetical protein